ncbi:S-layer homology domain-containing protein [Falsibacillus pallidus]|uniref:S-layer family protein n=1 Tax=Falsibacillus pallidus TaxID=493781 RepID=A0A370G8P6_9BACI|nr:S-layer homology domain-containing protein [Falsibacillus pallidus]RDI40155.1 S-layer family protein [Falsibacillus pallidus]
MAYQPKSYRKFVATAATAAVVASAIAPAASAASFTDVADRYKEAVDYLVSKDITNGLTDTKFGTGDNIKRVDAAIMVAKALGLSGDNAPAAGFTDVPDRGVKAVNALKEAGIINGKSATKFGADEFMTRAEMAKVIANAYKLTGSKDLPFTDVSKTFEQYVKALYEAGITGGKTDTKFGSDAQVTRGEFALFVYRAEHMTPATPEVVSVSAINAKKLEVKFNVEVNKTTAENAGTYSLVGVPAGTTWTPVLQDDNKTVVLTLNNAIQNDTTFVAIVNEVDTKADSTSMTDKFTKTINFKDNVKPVYTGVTYPEAGTAVLNFSEDLSTSGNVAVYDGSTDVTSSMTVNYSTGDDQISISGLTTDKEYKVVVVGAKDQSLNLISAPVEVYVKSTVNETVAPTISSVSTVDTTTVKVKFSEKLKLISAGKYANLSIDGTPVTGETQTFDSSTNTLTITKAGLTTQGVHSLAITGYKDLSSNSGADYTKASAFTLSAPVLEKTEVVSDTTDKYVQLTFNEAPNLSAVKGVEITGSYTTPDNVLKTVGTAAIDETNDVIVVGNTIKIKVTGFEAGSYKLSIPAAGISDGTTARTSALDVAFTLNASSDTATPAISNIYIPGENASAVGGPATVARNTFYVKYSKSMGSTAVNPDNYMIDGVKVFDSAVFVGDKTLVKLTLKDGSIALSGDRSFQISNSVKGENNVAINSFSSTENLSENVMPVLSSATLVNATDINLTFSEAVHDAELVQAAAGDDFEVYVDGVKAGIASVGTGTTADDKNLVVTLSTGITATQLANSTITVKVADTTDGMDLKGNPLTYDTVLTVAK